MRTYFSAFFLLAICCLTVQAQSGDRAGNGVLFEENKNQWPEQVRFKTRVANSQIFLEDQGLTYLLTSPEDLDAVHTLKHSKPHQAEGVDVHFHAFRMNFVGANNTELIRGLDKLTYYRNYFRGNDPSKWASKVGVYQGVRYEGIYDGVDALFFSQENNFKYDLIVKAGANPDQIVMSYQGLDGLEKNGENLNLQNSVVNLQEMAPFAYQSVNNNIVQVPCFFEVDGSEVRFSFPNGYDSNRDLVIDPTLIFATMTGSSSDNWGTTATNDVDGNFVGCGVTFGEFYPTTMGAFQETFGGVDGPLGTDMSVIKYNVDGTDALFSTYLGGGSAEFPHSSIVNADGEIILMGTTSSADFPMAPQAFDDTFGGGNATDLNNIGYPNGTDIVVAKLSADGSSLTGSTFLGGTENDGLNSSTNLSFNYSDDARGEVNVDSDNNIYITSSTESTDFPLTMGAFQQLFGGGSQDGVVVKLNSQLSNVFWSTYLGGLAEDAVYSSKVDANNDLYVTGGTNSPDLPTFGGTVNSSYQGGPADGFITHLRGADGDLINTTYLGTDDFDQAYLMDLDQNGNVYVVGQSLGDYPVTAGTFSNPGTTQFLHKVTPDLGTTIFSTVFGEGDEINISPTAFLVDECQRIYVSGWGGATQGAGNGSPADIGNTNGLFTTPDAIQSTTDGSDFYIILFAPNATEVDYASFFGSNEANEHVDGGTSRFDKSGVVYQAVCAGCGGNPFPTTPGVWSEENGSTNCNLGAFKFAFEQDEVIADFSTDTGICESLTVTFQNESQGADFFMWDFGDGNTSNEESPTYTYSESGTFTVQLNVFNPSTCITVVEDINLQVLDVANNADSGTISGGGIACFDDDIGVVSNGDATLDFDESLVFIISESPMPDADNSLVINATGTFSLDDGLEEETDYFIISAIADGDGNVDFDDPCSAFSPPVEAFWLSPVELEFENFCDEVTGEFSVTVFAFGGLPAIDGSSYQISGDGNFSLEEGEGATVDLGSFDGQAYAFSAIDEMGCSASETSNIISCVKNPIELLSFSGESRNDGNLLLWTTATEIDNDYFKVQRSQNGNQWETIAQLNGAGNSLVEIDYQHLDTQVHNEAYFYRLQSVDFNGIHESSTAIYIKRGAEQSIDFEIYPSPVQDYLIIDLANNVNSAQVHLIDISGKTIFESAISPENEGSTKLIDTSSLSSGIYILQVQAGLNTVVKKVVKE